MKYQECKRLHFYKIVIYDKNTKKTAVINNAVSVYDGFGGSPSYYCFCAPASEVLSKLNGDKELRSNCSDVYINGIPSIVCGVRKYKTRFEAIQLSSFGISGYLNNLKSHKITIHRKSKRSKMYKKIIDALRLSCSPCMTHRSCECVYGIRSSLK